MCVLCWEHLFAEKNLVDDHVGFIALKVFAYGCC